MLDLEAARGELERLRKKAAMGEGHAETLRLKKAKMNSAGRGLGMIEGHWLARWEAIEKGVARG